MLGYYNAKKELTLQVDTSLTGLSAALIQIEKELLAVVFGSARLEEYIVGHDITVESDCKPLEAIIRKPFHLPIVLGYGNVQ